MRPHPDRPPARRATHPAGPVRAVAARPVRSGTTPPRRGARRRTAAAGAVLSLLLGLLSLLTTHPAYAATVGAGSYATTAPGPLPSGCGQITGNPRQWATANAPAGAVPTNDWWSSILWKRTNCAYGEPLFAHPLGFRAGVSGLGFSYTTTPAISGSSTGVGEYHFPYAEDFTAGVAGLNAPEVKVDDWTDWTVSPLLTDGTHTLRATIGEGLPFAYFRATGGNAQITAASGSSLTVWSNTGSWVGYTVNGHDYAAYAPTGATWTASGAALSSSLAGKDYFSVAVLPTTSSTSASDRAALAASYARYAHNHVTGTKVSYRYDEATSKVTTTYAYTTAAREGSATGTVVSLLPHQWRYLAAGTPLPQTYVSARGALKILTGVTSFTTSMVYHGVLPEVPAVADASGADATTLQNHLNAEKGDPAKQVSDDTYWTGKGLGRAARLAEIADQTGNAGVRDAALAVVKSKLTDWFTASAGKTAHLFAYDKNWGTLIGYPASYGSDQELNDHHFHYGYFVAAAATLAKFDPAWASDSQYGGMVDLLIRDADNYDRTDTRFPYLRDFDIYDGHDWASGHGSFAAGNNQESSSEGMNFDNALIQWGEATGNTAVRDAGIYMYTTQAAAIQDYWFDSADQNYPANFGHREVGMVWGDGGAYSTWFSSAPEQIQGINLLPVTGGHLYLGYDPAYVLADYNDMLTQSGHTKPTIWADIWYEFLALGDGDKALTALRADAGYTPEEGESRAHTFHWVRNLAALGHVDTTVTGDHPLSSVFEKAGKRTYVAANITAAPLTVHFSDGTVLDVPAGRTKASGAVNWTGGTASGGIPPTGSPSPSPSDTATDTASPSPSDTASPSPSDTATDTASPSPSETIPTPPPGSGSPVMYLQTDGSVQGTKGTAGSVTVASAGGATHDGTPSNPVTYTSTGLTMPYNGGKTTFDLAVDAGTAVGNAPQVRVSYDCTGDGSWDWSETYHYFATDPVAGWEHYTQAAGLASANGTMCDLSNGTVRVEVWNALGNAATTLGTGDTSVVNLPYTAGTATPTSSPTATGTPTGGTSSPLLYPQTDGSVQGLAGPAGSTTIASAGGANHDGTPTGAQTYTSTGLTMAYKGGATAFDLAVDAGTAVGNAVQVKVSYDCTGDGSWDRTETYRYFATDPVAGWEHYTQAAGLASSSGTMCDLANGTVKVEVWNALGNASTTLGTGDRSVVTLPYN
ncbi:glycosyl hydrolase [Streptacidiphilus sp. ASG 303]|uniref:glycosyl hydrolase n=1 Tax=Streptacidiphilus sp. ASG 303 TaxID=2896847 RepID=UPI0027E0CFBD|nr:glycosyl hydrolase [Streptacidiphilus sp. ASG 303]